ncbi:MAG: hypothetical protein QOF14_3900 [Hyphomicrobiales bacterium]|jgi:hypothetical protein|nr:hypothetical protein [Hyphomicrobiales bacterium]
MRLAFVSVAICAAFLAAPASAQQTLPRPPSQMPPPGAQQKAPQQQQQQQKGAAPPQQAQPPMAPPAPYGTLTVAPPKPLDDPSLAAFRKDLTTIAQRKDRAALAKLVLVQGFFWLQESGNAAGKKTGIEALATALNLAAKDGSGWESLSEFAADETAAPYPDRPNTVCSPAGPQFNPADLEKLAESTKTDIGDWGFTAADGVEVRATATQNAPVIEKLGMQFVRVMPDVAPNASQDFMRIVTPSGKVGFVAAEAINPLGSDQLCYGKDAGGAWKIVGMIGGG